MAEVNADDLARQMLREDFLTFLEKAFLHLNPGQPDFEAEWYHEAIAHRLELVRSGELKRLMVTIPPRQLKSTIISVAWPAWMLGKNPTTRFVCVSFADDLAMKHARDCRSILQSDWYRASFPDVSLTRIAENDIETNRAGGRFSTTVGGTLTGRGGDVIIIDDPIKPEEANSDTARNGVNSWYQSTLLSRLNSQETGAIVLVMQRLHQNDLAGDLLEQGGWNQLRLPAVADEEESIVLPHGREHRRLPGELLDPARLSEATLQALRRSLGSLAFEAQFQQNPVPAEGNLIKRDWLKRYDQAPEFRTGDRIVQSWDTASKGGARNDWSACATALVRKHDVYLLDLSRVRLEFPDLKRKVVAMAQKYKPSTLLIEDAASGQQLLQQLRHDESLAQLKPLARKVTTDKMSRVRAASALVENGNVLFPKEAPWLADLSVQRSCRK